MSIFIYEDKRYLKKNSLNQIRHILANFGVEGFLRTHFINSLIKKLFNFLLYKILGYKLNYKMTSGYKICFHKIRQKKDKNWMNIPTNLFQCSSEFEH